MLTPYLIYIKVFLAGLMVAGLIGCGFYWGNKSGAEARRVLAEYKQKSEAAARLQETTISQLRTSNEGLSATLAVSLASTEAKVAEVRKSWATADAQKDSRIKALQSQVSIKSLALADLQARADAATDPLVRVALESQIRAEQQALLGAQEQVKGLECLNVTVPDDYIERLNLYANPPNQNLDHPPVTSQPANEPQAGRLDR